MNELRLRNRVFRVRAAHLGRTLPDETWHLEIETESEEFDGEHWAPSLYHQGLKLAAAVPAELDGLITTWSSPNRPSYPHPELGILYVFGHEVVRESQLGFQQHENGAIEVRWAGVADVFWDEPFAEDVPFSCVCMVSAGDA